MIGLLLATQDTVLLLLQRCTMQQRRAMCKWYPSWSLLAAT